MKETRTLELKESVSKSFLKTVSAFSNYNGGQIIFGIDDDGNIKGLANPKNTCLDIENRINDNIIPQPDYALRINEFDKTITLIIEEGKHKPYLYNSKAYKRNDTSTIEVDSFELTRLILEGKKINYESLRTNDQELTFHYLENRLKEHLHIDTFNKDTLITLNLFSEKDGYNNAANMLSDTNSFPGIDIAVFGNSIDIIKKRITLQNSSILEIYDRVIEIYRDYYQYEKIEGSYRKKIQIIPEKAFRESVANAIIHRAWDLPSSIRIAMFENKIEITSPGGLMNGITKDEYISGKISLLRNPILSNIFFRLDIVEIFGTGILRIMQAYENSLKKPIFNVNANTIQIVLPVYGTDYNLENDEKLLCEVLNNAIPLSISDILNHVPYSRSKAKVLLKKLVNEGIVKVVGTGKGTKYHL